MVEEELKMVCWMNSRPNDPDEPGKEGDMAIYKVLFAFSCLAFFEVLYCWPNRLAGGLICVIALLCVSPTGISYCWHFYQPSLSSYPNILIPSGQSQSVCRVRLVE